MASAATDDDAEFAFVVERARNTGGGATSGAFGTTNDAVRARRFADARSDVVRPVSARVRLKFERERPKAVRLRQQRCIRDLGEALVAAGPGDRRTQP